MSAIKYCQTVRGSEFAFQNMINDKFTSRKIIINEAYLNFYFLYMKWRDPNKDMRLQGCK